MGNAEAIAFVTFTRKSVQENGVRIRRRWNRKSEHVDRSDNEPSDRRNSRRRGRSGRNNSRGPDQSTERMGKKQQEKEEGKIESSTTEGVPSHRRRHERNGNSSGTIVVEKTRNMDLHLPKVRGSMRPTRRRTQCREMGEDGYKPSAENTDPKDREGRASAEEVRRGNCGLNFRPCAAPLGMS